MAAKRAFELRSLPLVGPLPLPSGTHLLVSSSPQDHAYPEAT